MAKIIRPIKPKPAGAKTPAPAPEPPKATFTYQGKMTSIDGGTREK